MKRRQRAADIGNLLYACAPLALYYLISSLAAFFYIQPLEIVLLTAVLAVPAFGWMYYRDLKERNGFSFRSMAFVPEIRPAVWAALGSVCLALLLNLLLLASPLPDWSAGYRQSQEAVYQGSIWMELAVSGVAAAVMEELLMRGLLYGRMREMMSVKSAVFWSSLAFGICHGNLVQGIYGFLMGCFLGYLMERFRTVLVPILAHMSANIFVIFLSESGGLDRLLQSPLLMAAVILGCGLASGLSVMRIRASGKTVVREKTEEN